MKLVDKTDTWSRGNKTYEGRYKKHICTIDFSSSKSFSVNPYWYYTFTNTITDKNYNSLWDGLKFETKEECHDACITAIDKILTDTNKR